MAQVAVDDVPSEDDSPAPAAALRSVVPVAAASRRLPGSSRRSQIGGDAESVLLAAAVDMDNDRHVGTQRFERV